MVSLYATTLCCPDANSSPEISHWLDELVALPAFQAQLTDRYGYTAIDWATFYKNRLEGFHPRPKTYSEYARMNIKSYQTIALGRHWDYAMQVLSGTNISSNKQVSEDHFRIIQTIWSDTDAAINFVDCTKDLFVPLYEKNSSTEAPFKAYLYRSDRFVGRTRLLKHLKEYR